jgi:hypothetical protein
VLTEHRYQINAKTELAVRYNNQSPLENHHCAVAFQILDNGDTNIFANVDQVKQRMIRDVSGTSFMSPPRSLARPFVFRRFFRFLLHCGRTTLTVSLLAHTGLKISAIFLRRLD